MCSPALAISVSPPGPVCCRPRWDASPCRSSLSIKTHRRYSVLPPGSPSVSQHHHHQHHSSCIAVLCACRSAGAEDVGVRVHSSSQCPATAQMYTGQVRTQHVWCTCSLVSMCVCVCVLYRLWENSKHVARQLDKIGMHVHVHLLILICSMSPSPSTWSGQV